MLAGGSAERWRPVIEPIKSRAQSAVRDQAGRTERAPESQASDAGSLAKLGPAIASGMFLVAALVVATLTCRYVSRPDLGDVLGSGFVLAAWLGLLFYLWREGRRAPFARAAGLVAWAGKRATGATMVAGLALLGLCLFTSYVTLQRFPNSADEYAQLFQAATYAQGRLWNPAPPDDVAQAFQTLFTVIRDGRWVGIYPPGWAALLTMAHFAGLPFWLINPALGLLGFVLLWLICAEIQLSPLARLACLLLATANSFFIFNAASFFSHTLVLDGALLFTLSVLRCQRKPSAADAILAGIGLGLAGTTRYLETAVVAVPALVSLLWFGPRQVRAVIPWLVLGALPFLAGLLWYHDVITGNPLLPPMVWRKPDDTLRFFAAHPEVHTISKGLLYVGARMVTWAEWTSPPMLLGYGLAFGYLLSRRKLRFFDLYLPGLMIVLLFYWGYGGNQYGPRYYHLGLPFAALAISRAASCPELRLSWRRVEVSAAATASLVALAMLYLVVWSFSVHQVITERRDLYRLVDRHGLSNALVIVADGTSPTYPINPRDLIRNGTSLDRDVIYALELDEQILRRRFPDRSFWRYERPEADPTGRLIRLETSP